MGICKPWAKRPLLSDLTGMVEPTSNVIYQHVCMYVLLKNPVDDVMAAEY